MREKSSILLSCPRQQSIPKVNWNETLSGAVIMRKEQHNHIVRAITPTETMSHEGDSLWWLNTWLGHWLVITTKPGSGVELKLFPLKYLLSPPRGSDPAGSSRDTEPEMKTILWLQICFVSLLCIRHDVISFLPSLSCPQPQHVE